MSSSRRPSNPGKTSLTRQRLAKVPTGFSLEPAQADELIAAGRALLRDNPDFRRLLEALGGTGAASSTK